MVKHIVLWKLTEESREQAPAEIKRRLEALEGKIPGMRCIQVGINILPGGHDVALYSEFESREALEGYQSHPAHMAVKEYMKTVVSDRAAVDYEG